MIKRPPPVDPGALAKILAAFPEQAAAYIALHTPTDDKGRYQHFDTLRFRIAKGLDPALAWSMVKQARRLQLTDIITLGDPAQPCALMSTPAMQKAVSACDRHTTTAVLEWMSQLRGEQSPVWYLLDDLAEDEAISSSQLEGAATTTRVAKELLKRNRTARTLDEKMIIGNFRMMQCAWRLRQQPMSVDLITELHRVGVEDIDDDHYRPGVLRCADDPVVVEDGDGNVVHTPPSGEGLSARLEALAHWANTDHGDLDSRTYLHPVIKAIVLHFAIGFEHPFHDGNGRVARSLFYWYLFQHDFAAFRYIAISTLLKTAPVQYGKSYLYTETDGMDLTYFVDYQCRVIGRAIHDFTQAYEQSVQEADSFDTFLVSSGLGEALNEKQKLILQLARSGKQTLFTTTGVADTLACAYNTAAAVLNGLVEHGQLNKRKEGREWVFEGVARP